jgi:hypothetical protein
LEERRLKKKNTKAARGNKGSWIRNHRWEIFGITLALSLEFVAVLGLTLFYSFSSSNQTVERVVREIGSLSEGSEIVTDYQAPSIFQKDQ